MTPQRRDFLFPVKALSRVFRSKYLDALARTYHRGDLLFPDALQCLSAPASFARFLQGLFAHD